MSSVFSFHDNSATEAMPPDHHYEISSGDEATGANSDFFDDHPLLEAIFCYGWLFLLFYCLLCRKTREMPSTEIGDQIRARARQAQERLQQAKIKEELSPAERKRVVDENMITKIVLVKDEKGNLTLGGTTGTADDDQDVNDTSGDDVDVEAQQEHDQADNNNKKKITHLAADDDNGGDDEGFTCVICLDCFEKGDLVSWTKHDPTCTHVFHDECIRQWLEERRQDECPSCRCNLVPPVQVPNCKSIIIEDDDDENNNNEEEPNNNNEETGEEHQQAQETDDSENPAAAAAAASAQPKEDGESESALFAMMSGLLNRATASISQQHQQQQQQPQQRRPPSAPASGNYNLVSVNSNSFDSQEGESSPEPIVVVVQEDPPPQEPSESSSSDEEQESSNQQQWLSSNNNNNNTFSSSSVDDEVTMMSISEALRQSEVMMMEQDHHDHDEEMGGAATTTLGMQDAVVSDIVFSP